MTVLTAFSIPNTTVNAGKICLVNYPGVNKEIEILFSWAKIHITASQSLMPLNPAAKLMGKMRAAGGGSYNQEEELKWRSGPM